LNKVVLTYISALVGFLSKIVISVGNILVQNDNSRCPRYLISKLA